MSNDKTASIASIEQLMALGLTKGEAHIVRNTVPIRGTDEWNYREGLRQKVGNRCMSYGLLPMARVVE